MPQNAVDVDFEMIICQLESEIERKEKELQSESLLLNEESEKTEADNQFDYTVQDEQDRLSE